jgi:hypothetical protein
MSYVISGSRGFGAVTPNELSSIGAGISNIFKLGTSSAPTSTQVEGSIASALGTAAMIPSPATPFLAAGAAIAGLLAQFGVGSGCGQSCVLSTQYANAAESALQQNIAAYRSIPTPRWTGYQTQALQNFDKVWNDLVSQCSNPALGDAGKRCITDRQSGSCVWRNADGSCFNWWAGYHDPIANDPDVTDVPPSTFSAGSSSLTNVGSSLTAAGGSSLLLPIALLAGAVLLVMAVSK